MRVLLALLFLSVYSSEQDMPFRVGHTHRNVSAVWPDACVSDPEKSSPVIQLVILTPLDCQQEPLRLAVARRGEVITVSGNGGTEFKSGAVNESDLLLVMVADHNSYWLPPSPCEEQGQHPLHINVQRVCHPSDYYTITYKAQGLAGDVLLGMASYLQWTEFILIYDQTTREDFRLRCPNGVRCPAYAAYDIRADNIADDVNTAFNDVSKLHELHLVVMCSLDCTLSVIQQANHFDDTRPQQGYFLYEHRWVLVMQDRSWLDVLAPYVGNVTNVVAVVPAVHVRTVTQVYVDDIIAQADVIFQFGDSLFRLRPPCSQACESTLLTKNTMLSPYTVYNIVSQQFTNRSRHSYSYDIMTAMYVSNGSGITIRQFQPVGKYEADGLVIDLALYPNTQFGFNGRKLVISTNYWGPFMSKTETGERVGLCMDMLSEISQSLNFSYILVEPPDMKWGAFDSTTGTWNGLVRQLQYKEIDMVVAPIAIEHQRAGVMDFCEVPMYYENSIVMIRTPSSQLDTIVLFLKPFRMDVWACIVASVVLCSLALWLANLLSPGENTRQKRLGLGSWRHSFWTAFGIVLYQSSFHRPRAQSGRIILSFWLVYCIIVLATYSGNLIAFLTVVKSSLPFKTLEGLVSQTQYSFGTLSGTVWEVLFMQGNLPVYAQFRDMMVEFNKSDPGVLGSSHQGHIDKVKRGSYAYVTDQTQFEMAIASSCEFVRMKETFSPLTYSIGLQKNSAYQKMINQIMNYLHDTGLMHYWRDKYWPKVSKCLLQQDNTDHKVLKIFHVRGIFYAFLALLAVAIVVLLLEILVKNLVKKQKCWPTGK